MTEDSSSALVEEYIESVWNRGDLESLHRLTSPGFRYFLGGHPGRDHAEMAEFLTQTRRAFPDWRVAVSLVVSDGSHVAVRWTGRVTHGGEFRGIPATGREIEVSGINLYEVAGEKIVAEWEQMDSIGMLRQLGAGG